MDPLPGGRRGEPRGFLRPGSRDVRGLGGRLGTGVHQEENQGGLGAGPPAGEGPGTAQKVQRRSGGGNPEDARGRRQPPANRRRLRVLAQHRPEGPAAGRDCTMSNRSNLFDDGGCCKRCRCRKEDHGLSQGSDGVRRIVCRGCPLQSMRLMGDEGTQFPIPFFIEGPFGPPHPCFGQNRGSRRMSNFLPRSPGPKGLVQLKLHGKGRGIDVGLEFSGTAWYVDEVDHLEYGDDVHDNLVYKHQLYWDQNGLCAGCRRLIWFDNMELDRITAGAQGGEYTVGNVQLLCPGCNRIKGNRGMDHLKARRRDEGILDC